ncbi:MAG: polyphosphate polymerase domain-containing protein [Pseudomonadales bacterium]|nr:polyphosphate polymerase domain-containing protein [Pseudomonadales bacterium]
MHAAALLASISGKTDHLSGYQGGEDVDFHARSIIPADVTVALAAMKSHGLDDLNNAKLMRRVDTKYLVPIAKLAEVLAQMSDYYSVLEIEGGRSSKYKTTYYDTDGLDFYHQHHRGSMNRFKVRHRHYQDSDTAYLEVKHKGNKGFTNKKRVHVGTTASDDLADVKNFLQSLNVPSIDGLRAKQQGSYRRIALANETVGERLTLDFDLKFSDWNNDHDGTHLPHFFIAELKQARLNRNSPFVDVMRKWNIRPENFSKYCMGCCLLGDDSLKKNRFKPLLNQLNKFNA